MSNVAARLLLNQMTGKLFRLRAASLGGNLLADLPGMSEIIASRLAWRTVLL